MPPQASETFGVIVKLNGEALPTSIPIRKEELDCVAVGDHAALLDAAFSLWSRIKPM